MMPHKQVIIIGGGPAGVACAIQLKRYGIDPLLFEKESIGGLVRNAWRLDNYPGFPEGINGPEMAVRISLHMKRFDIRYSPTAIRHAHYSHRSFELKGAGHEYSCDHLVIATGTRPLHASTGISLFHNDKILTEVWPIRDVRGKTIVIIGAGDAAFDYAMTLSERNKVFIHNRGTRIRCVPALLEMALKQPNIAYTENSELISAGSSHGKIYPVFNDPDAEPSGYADYIIFATGREAELSFVSDELRAKQAQLEHDGILYFIGDVKNGMVRQTSVAAGDGIRAAMAIREKLKK